MSQVYKPSIGGGGIIPPNVATTYVTDSGSAVPAANILNVLTSDTTSNFDNGITDTGSGSTVTILLSNRQTGTVPTADATLTTIITFPLGAVAGTFYVYGNLQAFNASTPSGGGYSYSGAYRTDGATATELGTEFHDEFEDPVLLGADIFLSASGNNVILQVQGIAGLSINWNALLEFRKVS